MITKYGERKEIVLVVQIDCVYNMGNFLVMFNPDFLIHTVHTSMGQRHGI